MIQLEDMPILLESQRAYLRSLAHPVPDGVRVPPRREAIGRALVRFGRWLENQRPEVAPVARMPAGNHA
jgi:hypothetical protein